MKKTRTGNGHSYKAKFKVKRKEEIVPVELAPGQTEKLSHQENEQVHPQTSVLAGLDQQKNFCPRPNEIGVIDLNKEVPLENPEAVELSNSTSNKGIDKGDAIGLPLVEQISEQTKASWTPYPCVLSQESEDIPCSPFFDVIPDVDAQVIEAQNTETVTLTPENTSSEQIGTVQDQSVEVVEKQKASPIEVAAASVHVDSVTVNQPNIELHDQLAPDTSRDKVANLETIDISHEEHSEILQDQDASVLQNQATSRVEIVNPLQSNVGAPEIQDCEELVPTEVEIQSHNLERSSSQTAEIAGNFVHLERTVEIPDAMLLSSESTSQLLGNQNLPNNHFSQVNVDLTLHEAGLVGRSVGNLYGSSNQFSNHQYEQLHKSHEDMQSQLKSDCEKEIQEAFAQLRNKYKLKLQVAEAELNYKKNVLNKNLSKVLRNKILAESFSSICEDHLWLRDIQQASPSSSMQ